jgi:hypothetical protein
LNRSTTRTKEPVMKIKIVKKPSDKQAKKIALVGAY